MAVKLRLMRMGKTKQPTYRVVAADGRSPRDGRFIEIVGFYEPRKEPSGVEIDNEKADRKSTRLNSSHLVITYAVCCLKKKMSRGLGITQRILAVVTAHALSGTLQKLSGISSMQRPRSQPRGRVLSTDAAPPEAAAHAA